MQTESWTTHMAEILCPEPTHLGFCDASGIDTEGVWLDTSISGSGIVWRHPWSPEIITALVLNTNPGGTRTNSNLKLIAPILHKTTLMEVCTDANMATPRSGSD